MSATINNGGPAFPTGHTTKETVHYGADGMTLRDWFAGQALAGMLANGFMPGAVLRAGVEDDGDPFGQETYHYDRAAYALADAMLKAREAKP